MPTSAELDAVLRQDLLSFVYKVFATLEPGRELAENWHLEAMAHQLDRVDAGETRRLMINVPPRTLKSIAVSVAWPAFLMGHDPTLEIMVVSHNLELAADLHNKFRKVVDSEWYKAAFPTMRGAPAKDTERVFETTQGGRRMAVSVNGSVTGLGGDLIIIDDPLDASDADIEEPCAKVNHWIDTTLMSRVNDPHTPIVLVMQRLSVNDPAAHLAATGAWERLVLPAVAEEDRVIDLGGGARRQVRKGDLLHPERLPIEFLEARRRQMGEAAYLAQYQQRPIPGGGGAIDVSLFRRYEAPPKAYDAAFISVDAASGSDSGSYSVLQTYRIADGRLYLTDSQRGRWPFPELRRRVIDLQARINATYIVVEYASSGQALAEELWEHCPPDVRAHLIQPFKPKHSKEVRMDRALVQISEGRVFLPKSAPWLEALLNELQAFPNGVNDDQADALSQAVHLFRWHHDRFHPEGCNRSRLTLIG